MNRLLLTLALLFALVAPGCGDDLTKETPPNSSNSGNNSGVDAGDAANNQADGGDSTDMGAADCPIEADCSGRVCGADPVCGTSCGTCGADEMCSGDGQCVCIPNCDGKVCGDDGCGGSCGTCEGDDVCNTQSGVCAETCTPVTCSDVGAECGVIDDGCGGQVTCTGTCTAPESCGGGGTPNQCGCMPQCAGRECGADSCGGSCGTCPAGEMCNPTGVCFNEAPTITVDQPSAAGAQASSTFPIRWTDSDPDDDATVSLYWDDDASGQDGTLIVAGLSEDDISDTYSWDVSGLADGDYWVYAIIEDPFATAVDYSDGPLTKVTSTCSFATNGAVTVDVPAIDVSIDVTLDGQPISAANTNDGDEGKIILRDPVTGDTIDLGGVWNDANDTSFAPFQIRIVAGTYDVYYSIVDAGTSWPLNTNRLLQAGVTIDSNSNNLTIDVPTVDASVDVTLNGSPVSAANTNDADEGKIVLRDPNTGESIDLGGVWDDANDLPLTPYSIRLVAGNYDAYYGIVDQGTSWPRNTNRLIRSGIDFSTSNAVTLDIQAIDAVVDVTLDGQGVSAANTGDFDEGEIQLRDPDTSDVIDLNGVWDDANDVSFTPFQIRVVAGTYDAYYSIVDQGPNWPINTNRLLQKGVTLTASQATVIDVPSASVSIDVTLAGQPISAANTGDFDEGELRLVDPSTGELIDLNGVWDDSTDTALTPYQVNIVGGDYDIYYSIVDQGPNWPINTNRLLQSGVSLVDGTMTTIDVPAADFTLDLLLDGSPVSAANTDDFDEPELRLQDPATGEVIDLNGAWDDANDLPLTPYDFRVVGGSYDVYYGIVDAGTSWPINTNRLVRAGLAVTDGGSDSINIVPIDASIDVTLAGQPLSSVNTGDSDEGELRLVDPETGEVVDLNGVWDDANDVVFTPYDVRLVSGEYDVYYGIVDQGASWPLNTSRRLQCVEF